MFRRGGSPGLLLWLGVLLAAMVLHAAGAADSNRESRMQQGLRLHDGGDFAGAIAIYRELLDQDPRDSYLLYELALSCYSAQRFEEAIGYARKGLAAGPAHGVETSILLGASFDASGKLGKGEKAFRQALKEHPAESRLHYGLGVNLNSQGKHPEAVEAQTATETVERPAVVRQAPQILAVNGLRLRGPTGREQRGPESVPHRLDPVGRLVALFSGAQPVFPRDGLAQGRQSLLLLPGAEQELPVEQLPDDPQEVDRRVVAGRPGRGDGGRRRDVGLLLGTRLVELASRRPRHAPRRPAQGARQRELGLGVRRCENFVPAPEADQDLELHGEGAIDEAGVLAGIVGRDAVDHRADGPEGLRAPPRHDRPPGVHLVVVRHVDAVEALPRDRSR